MTESTPTNLESETTSESKGVVLVHAELSDIGMRREENQDSYGVIETPSAKILLVADGMGGVKGGAIASNLAVKVMREALTGKEQVAPADISAAVQSSNAQIYEQGLSDSSLSGMGTTMVGLCFNQDKLIVFNVGDSRAYRARQNHLTKLTVDHTLVMELLKSGTISAEQVQNHPVSHMLTRSLGPAEEVAVDCSFCRDDPQKGDRYLLCSDGLYNLVKDEEILAILQSNPVDLACQLLVNLANQRGGTDNITVICAALDDEETLAKQREGRLKSGGDRAAYTNGHAYASSGNGQDPSYQGAPAQPAVSTPPQQAFFGSRLMMLLAFVATSLAGVGIGVWISLPSHSSASLARVVEEQAALGNMLSQSQNSTVKTQESRPEVIQPERTVRELDLPKEGYINDHKVENTAEADTLQSRKQILEERIAAMELKLTAFEGPISGALGELLATARSDEGKINQRLDEIRAEIDLATRKLAVWYGRRKRLASTEAFNLASEVAVSSENVRSLKEEFEATTWVYLKEAEVLKYNPTDVAQQKKVGEALTNRRQRMLDLSDAIRRAIDEAIAESDGHITELTLERERLENQLQALQLDINFAKVIAGDNSEEKQRLKFELEKELEVAGLELAELEKIGGGQDQALVELPLAELDQLDPSAAALQDQQGQSNPPSF